jgi:hypothetical protein
MIPRAKDSMVNTAHIQENSELGLLKFGDSICADLKHGLFPVNEPTMNLTPKRIYHGYLEVLIVAQAFVTEVLRKFFAMRNRIGICVELNPDSISVRDAVFHIEEIRLHRTSSSSVSRQRAAAI